MGGGGAISSTCCRKETDFADRYGIHIKNQFACAADEPMCNAYGWRWLLLLAGLGAISGCAQLTGDVASAPGQLDPRLVAERHASPEADFRIPAQIPALEAGWAKMPNGSNGRDVAPEPAVATAPREQPVVLSEASRTTESQAADAPVISTSGTTLRRSLWDKQPWEVELDKLVRSICRGC
jgi:hypothetical protein